ncbi:hypothetical protein HYPSUDRAFT_140380 [Hypholoma sublateritium FD-334 SS-4]|uniref:Response regulatory domain-containing protein n=1 Tax=Hypholoma sublateritium (strain FD-334 SS-4) TaxID=945553 RepID=A0A0D2MDS8_HYPSF|nr:hypothetical protein HYPSUDRAFT_140380 [Hypholoma sublateritium FD-334 SS-4]
MSIPKLPALRLTAEGECIVQEGVYLDMSSKNKFSVSYASTEGRQNLAMGGSKASASGLINGEAQSRDSRENSQKPALPSMEELPAMGIPLLPERLSMTRTLSMPLPSQLSHLQHPHRLGAANQLQVSPAGLSPHLREVSMELADSIQLAIQTMLQISPPQVLDPAKEQFSACALSVPTSSMSALFTTMKNINYISANMSSFCEQPTAPERTSHNEFDVGEMLQCVGDALSGAAAHIGVDLVIYHGDVGLKHVYVSGDESGISFALSHIVRQVMGTAERGDSIELGLLVNPVSIPITGIGPLAESPPIDDMLTAAPLESNGPVQITVRISHKYVNSEPQQGQLTDVDTAEIRPKPYFSALLLRRILRQIGGNLIADLPPPATFASGRTCDLEIVLDRMPFPVPSHVADENSVITVGDPTLEQLSSFGESLKGKQVTLYASARGSFAQHLTSYLTAWGMDVTHASLDGQVDGLADQKQEDGRAPPYNQPTGPSGKPDERPAHQENPSFIVVDDDVDILKNKLQALRFENQPSFLGSGSKKRPQLASRQRSTSQMARLLGPTSNFMRPLSPVVILHFTSLANYKTVRDMMTSITISYTATSTPLPEVMIIPKPAGPRRFLTALHTAVTKPIVDPLFMPIATSPVSPGLRDSDGSFFAMGAMDQSSTSNMNGSSGSASQAASPAMKTGPRPRGSRSNSDRSTRSNSDAANTTNAIPPSPLALPDNVEYFSAAAQKLGSSPSSGLVIQSPDGQTAGIYFHPRSKNGSRNVSSSSMERGNGQLTVSDAGKINSARSPSINSGRPGLDQGKMGSFSSLHEAHSPAQESPRPAIYVQPAPKRTTSTSSSPATSSPTANAAGLVEEPAPSEPPPPPPPSLAAAILSPMPRRKSEERQGLGVTGIPTAVEVASPPPRRAGPKRGSDARQALAAANKKRGKTALSDNTVVPPISVLIVDDNPINQTILSTFMKRKRIKYDLASNGQEAVQKWRNGGFHLILMDIQMPVMDGIQATTEIRRIEKLNAASGYPLPSPSTENGMLTPSSTSGSATSLSEFRSIDSPYRSSVIIVALTASSLQSDRVAALAAGCNDFLTKPVSLLWLNNKIIEWGSIKALQMWADIRPDAVETMQSGQAAQATRVAARLHVPPSAKVPSRWSSMLDDNAAALALASSGGPLRTPAVAMIPPSPTASYFKIPEQQQSTGSGSWLGNPLNEHPSPVDGAPAAPAKRGSGDSEDGERLFVFS